MKHNHAVDYLLGLPRRMEDYGFHKMIWLSDRIYEAYPSASFDAIKITGTNGKGSTCNLISSILTAAGIDHGLYTSPHLIRFNERIAVNGTPIDDSDLARGVGWFREVNSRFRQEFPHEEINAFEAYTAIALHYFAGKGIRYLVSESGQGGRFDFTRVIPGRLMVLTSVDLEHTERLGKTIELITYEKLDLCGEGSTAIIGRLDDQSLSLRARGYCRLKQMTPVFLEDECSVHSLEYKDGAMLFDARIWKDEGQRFSLNLCGTHQADNALMAIMAARRFGEQNGFHITPDAVKTGLSSARWPGRFETIGRNPRIIIDIAHTPKAATALAHTAGQALADQNILLVMGFHQKRSRENVAEMITNLTGMATEVIATRPLHKGMDGSIVENLTRQIRPQLKVRSSPTIEDALAMAVSRAKARGMAVLITGSLAISAEASELVDGRSPHDLGFFN